VSASSKTRIFFDDECGGARRSICIVDCGFDLLADVEFGHRVTFHSLLDRSLTRAIAKIVAVALGAVLRIIQNEQGFHCLISSIRTNNSLLAAVHFENRAPHPANRFAPLLLASQFNLTESTSVMAKRV
jgi:hypothetical protein